VDFPISVYNHPPYLEDVIFITDSSIYKTRKEVEYPIHVSPTSPGFKVEVRVLEADHLSELLNIGEGKILSRIQVHILMYDHPLELFSSERSFTKEDTGDNGRYRSVFEIDTNIQQGKFDPWISGRYLLNRIKLY